MRQSDHSITRKLPFTFAAITVFGVAALLVGLALILFAHYHVGIVALIVGTIYLVVLEYHGHAYFLLLAGTVCLIGGIICGMFAQSRARATSR